MATRKTRRGRKSPGRHSASPRKPHDLAEPLADIVRDLRLAAATVMVCIEALDRRNVELDREMALVLRRGASDRVDAAISGLAALARSSLPRAP